MGRWPRFPRQPSNPSLRALHSKHSAKRPWRRLRYFYYRFIRIKDQTNSIARGLAAGVFAGCFPIFGIQMFAGGALAALVRGNIPIAIAGTWISNPVTYIPLFIFNYHVGIWILGTTAESLVATQSLKKLMALGANFALIPLLQELTTLGAGFLVPLFTGCIFVGLICSTTSYGLAQWLLHNGRQRRANRRKPR